MAETFTEQAEQLGERLLTAGLTVTTAESCTGGGIAKAITACAGSSQWFEFGFVTYANRAKQQLLGVRETSLSNHGAVSEAVVKEMAQGALAVSGADLAVAVSGIAGPDGGSPEKPVGTVWFCWLRRGGDPLARCFQFEGDRAEVRARAIEAGLTGLLDML